MRHIYVLLQKFIYTVILGMLLICVSAINPAFSQCTQPSAGSDVLTVASSTVVLTGSPTGGTWTALGANPAGATLFIPPTTGGAQVQLSPTASAGIYRFVYTVTGGCSDTMRVVVRSTCDIYPVNSSSQSQSLSYNGSNSLATGTSRQGATCKTYGPGSHVKMTISNVTGSIPAGDIAYFSVTEGIYSPFPTFVATGQPVYFTLEQLMSGQIYTSTTQPVNSQAVFQFQYYIQGNTSASFGYTWTPTVLECNTTKPAITPSTATNACPATTVNLTTLAKTGTIPSGSTLVWSTYKPVPNSGDTLTISQATSVNTSGKYYAYYRNASGCFSNPDSVTVTINDCPACVKPVAKASPKSQSICAGSSVTAYTATPSTGVAYKWYGPLTDTTSTLGTAISGATTASYTPTGSGITSAGTKYYAVVVNNTGDVSCSDTAFVQLIVNAKPNAGTDQTLVCSGSTPPATATLSPTPTGGTWSNQTGNPTTATFLGNDVSDMTVAGTYNFIYTVTGGCSDTVKVIVPSNCSTPVFDLALMKKLATGQSSSVTVGGTVKFTISIINQGTVDATNVQISDYIPTGLTLNDANWTATGSTATLNTPIASLLAGQTLTRDITFTVAAGASGTITNFAEISSATGGTDIDSTPDSNPSNDGTPINDVVNENGLTGGDEDDHDPESITVSAAPVFDLALMKKLATGQSSSVTVGGTVKFTISIINQGTVDATNVQISDYIPTGLTLNDANWTATGSTATLNTPIASLLAGQTLTQDITFTVAAGASGTITNFAEISSATGGTDIDSTPDSNSSNDGTPINDVVNEDHKNNPAQDEDDHDLEAISVVSCTPPNAGLDVTICLPKTTVNLIDAPSGYEWVEGSGNPTTVTLNASTGVASGLTVVGTYTFRLQKIGELTCFDEIQVTVTNGDAAIVLCNDGSTSYTLIAQANVTNVVWYNMSGQQVGTGSTLVVTATTTGLSDGSEAFYYVGLDASSCDAELCCPVKFVTQNCCPQPNCLGISVIKN